jgi:hypothetical protein
LSKVVAKGALRPSLEALRDVLAAQIETCDSARDVAALSARLMDVLARLDAMPAPVEGTVLDELAKRRTDAGRVAARPARARRG